ncbi:MAG: FecR domain-containing protein [Opitutus sp.]
MIPPASTHEPKDRDFERIREQAIDWIVRRDRGLSAKETQEFLAWTAADARHSAALDRSTWTWGKLQMPDEVRTHESFKGLARSPWRFATTAGLAAACALLIAVWSQRTSPRESTPKTEQVAAVATPVTTRVLSDGSTVRLAEGSEIATSFTPEERRVTVSRGEAYFEVTKDPRRPFVVQASKVRVQAIGTAFAVRLQSGDVDVLVTEGTVAVGAGTEPPTSDANSQGTQSSSTPAQSPTQVTAGHRAMVRIPPVGEQPVTVVTILNKSEMSRLLHWRESLIEFDGASLRMIAQQFERRTGAKIEFADATVGETRLGGSFPPHDLDGFLALLGENYGIQASRRSDGRIVLSKSP